MSFGISSSVYPTASNAPIFAIGKPVALDASADERETRVHLDRRDDPSGSTANWMFELPVSTPIARMHAVASSHLLVLAVGASAPAPR